MLRLGVVGEILRLVVDTNHFKGNYPESVSADACLMPDGKSQVPPTFMFNRLVRECAGGRVRSRESNVAFFDLFAAVVDSKLSILFC